MTVCDICSAPGIGTVISAENMRQAVFKNGFNPLSLGLVRDPMARMNKTEWYEGWKNTIVAQDTSDWNICSNCMAKLKAYLMGTPKPTGVKKATVSANPIASALAGAAVKEKYAEERMEGASKLNRLTGYLLATGGLLMLGVGLMSFAGYMIAALDPTLVGNSQGIGVETTVICILPIPIIGIVLLRSGISRLRN